MNKLKIKTIFRVSAKIFTKKRKPINLLYIIKSKEAKITQRLDGSIEIHIKGIDIVRSKLIHSRYPKY